MALRFLPIREELNVITTEHMMQRNVNMLISYIWTGKIMDMLWPVIGTIYGLAYLIYGIAWAVIEIQRRNLLLGIGTGVIALIGTAGLMLYCCRIHNDAAIAAWKIIVLPYVILTVGVICFKAWKNRDNTKSKSVANEIGNALLVEAACLYFNLKYAFFFN